MNEPYLLGNICDGKLVNRKTKETKAKEERNKEEPERETNTKGKEDQTGNNKTSKRCVHTFSAWMGHQWCLVLSLWFV
jgi:hypothetical protein